MRWLLKWPIQRNNFLNNFFFLDIPQKIPNYMNLLSSLLQTRDLKIDMKSFKNEIEKKSKINNSVRNDLNSLYFHGGHQKVILYPIICIDCLWNCNALYHKPGCTVINICTILFVLDFFFYLTWFHFLSKESYFVVFLCRDNIQNHSY